RWPLPVLHNERKAQGKRQEGGSGDSNKAAAKHAVVGESSSRANTMPPLVIVLAIVVVLVFLSLRVVKEYDRGVIFFLGKYTSVRGPGLIILIPVLERMTRVTFRTITMNIPSQKIITKDNVSIDIAAVAYYHIVDPKKSVIA